MIIDKKQLISLLIKKTDLDREAVNDQLSILIDRIRQAADEGKTLEIEGFGTFAMEGDNLEFVPTDVLETEINNKYAGMKPIELIGAFKEPEGDEIPDIDAEVPQLSETTWNFDKQSEDEQAELDAQMKATEGSSVDEKGSPTPDASEAETTEAEEVEETAASDTEEGLDEQEASSDSGSNQDSETKAEGEKQKRPEFGEVNTQEAVKKIFSIDKESVSSEEDEDQEADSREKEADPIGTFLVAAIVVLALGIGGWFVYDLGLIGAGNSTSVSNTSASEPVENVTVDQSDSQQDQSEESAKATENKRTSEPEQTLQVVKPEDNQSQSRDRQTQVPYGLRGELSDVTGGYTIVVHSLRTMPKAENNRRQLEEKGYRTLINEADVNGTTYYRVGIGQFETVGDALDSITVLPEPLKSNNFIKRIR